MTYRGRTRRRGRCSLDSGSHQQYPGPTDQKLKPTVVVVGGFVVVVVVVMVLVLCGGIISGILGEIV